MPMNKLCNLLSNNYPANYGIRASQKEFSKFTDYKTKIPGFTCAFLTNFIVYDSIEDYLENNKIKLREKALAKLTEQEKIALGLK